MNFRFLLFGSLNLANRSGTDSRNLSRSGAQLCQHAILNAARLWTEFSSDQKQRLQKVLFPPRGDYCGRDL